MSDSSKNTTTQVEPSRLSVTEAAAPSRSSSSSTPTSTAAVTSKSDLRKIMVSCIDSALEELGPLSASDLADLKAKPLIPPDTSNVAINSTPTAESLYGALSEPTKIVPDLQIRGPMRRPRYQRRGSVTKFSLSCTLKDIQKDDHESNLKKFQPKLVGSMTNRQLWHQLYTTPIKPSAALSLNASGARPLVPAELDMPAPKRRRGLF